MKKKQKRKKKAEWMPRSGNKTRSIYSTTQGQTRKTRRSPGGAIINSKTKYARRYEFQDKMPSHGQHYLKDSSNPACFPYTPRNSNWQRQHGTQVVIRTSQEKRWI